VKQKQKEFLAKHVYIPEEPYLEKAKELKLEDQKALYHKQLKVGKQAVGLLRKDINQLQSAFESQILEEKN